LLRNWQVEYVRWKLIYGKFYETGQLDVHKHQIQESMPMNRKFSFKVSRRTPSWYSTRAQDFITTSSSHIPHTTPEGV
jgi:hypothetical protein